MNTRTRSPLIPLGLSTGLVALTLGLLGRMARPGLAKPLGTDVTGPINSPTTWVAAASPYVLKNDIVVATGVTLTIEPGVVVQGENNLRLEIQGYLDAVGTAGQPITFTSAADSGPGGWAGLLFEGGAGHLGYATVRYGGDSDGVKRSNVTVRNVSAGEVHIEHSAVLSGPDTAVQDDYGLYVEGARVAVDDVLIANNGSGLGDDYGLYAATGSVVTVTSSTFQDNQGWAVGVEADEVRRVTGNSFNGNQFDRVRITGGSVGADLTLTSQTGLDGYELKEDLTVSGGATLTVAPGVAVMGANGKALKVAGYLDAVGTAGQPITFTSAADSGPGGWAGLLFDGGAGHLAYATVRYGGDSDGVKRSNVTVRNVSAGEVRIEHSAVLSGPDTAVLDDYGLYVENARVLVDDVLIANNGSDYGDDYGLYAAAGSVVTVTGSTFQGNQGWAIGVLEADSIRRVTGNSFSGNTYDRVRIVGSSVGADLTLTAQTGLDGYELKENLTVSGGATLTVDPGVAVMGANGKALKVLGYLDAVGTAAQPITFTSAADSGPGGWAGLLFDGGEGHLKYATVRYGGDSNGVTNSNVTARNVSAGEVKIEDCQVLTASSGTIAAAYGLYAAGSRVVVSRTTFAGNIAGNSDDYGLYADGGSVVTVTGSTFRDNGGYAVGVTADGVRRMTGNSFSGNTYDRVRIVGGSVGVDLTLISQSGLDGYELKEGLTVSGGATLTVNPGVVVMGADGKALKVLGYLNAVGTDTQPITFTSAADSGPGGWAGLLFDGGAGHLAYATVRYGGDSDGVKRSNVTVRNVSAGEVRIENSAVLSGPDTAILDDYGLYVEGARVIVDDVLVADNGSGVGSDYGLYAAGGSVVTVTGSTFQGNRGWAIGVETDGVRRVTGNTFSGNTYDRVRIMDGSVMADTTLVAQTGLEGYELQGSVIVTTGVTLTVPPGVMVMGEDDGLLKVAGYLDAVGTAAQPITFTSADDSGPGQWAGLFFDGGAGYLRHAIVRYGGDAGGLKYSGIAVRDVLAGEVRIENSQVVSTSSGTIAEDYGLYVEASRVIVSDTILTDNGSGIEDHGLYAASGSVITVTGSTVRDNRGDGVTVDGGHVTMTCVTVADNQTDGIRFTSAGHVHVFSSGIRDNDGDGLHNDTGVTVDARYNWWGSSTGPAHSSNPGGTGDAVSDDVTFNPWLKKAMCASIDDADLAVAGSVSPGWVPAGDPLTYTFTITNYGPAGAESVTHTYTLPGNVTLDQVTSSQGTCSVAGGAAITCTMGAMAINDTATITVFVTSTLEGMVTKMARVNGNRTDPDLGDNTAAVETCVGPVTDLVVTKVASSGAVTAGRLLTYTVIVTNAGPSEAAGVTLTDTLPVSATLESAVASRGSGCTPSGRKIICPLDDLASGDAAVITLVVSVDPMARGGITNEATAEGAGHDPNAGNSTVTVETPVSAEADLQVVKTGSSGIAVVDNPLRYMISVTNFGPSAATGVTLIDVLPPGVTFASATPTQGTGCGESGGTVTCGLGTLYPSGTAGVTLIVTPTVEGAITNEARVSSVDPDPDAANNTDEENTAVKSDWELYLPLVPKG